MVLSYPEVFCRTPNVIVLWVLMMHYRQCSAARCRNLISTLSKAESLFKSPKGDIAASIAQVNSVLKECVELGVEVPWDTTGRLVLRALWTKGYETVLAPFKQGGPDPRDCAPHFEEMLIAIDSAAPDIEEAVEANGQKRRAMNAYEAHCYEIRASGESINQPYELIISPNPDYNPQLNPSGQESSFEHSAYETRYEGFEGQAGWDHAQEGWGEGLGRPEPQSHSESYDHAYFTRAEPYKGGKGKAMSYGKGSPFGKGKGKEKGKETKGKGKSDGKGSSKGGRGPYPSQNPYAKKCSAQGCEREVTPGYTFCYPCTQNARAGNSLILCKDGSKKEVPPRANYWANQTSYPYTANEAEYYEEWNEGMAPNEGAQPSFGEAFTSDQIDQLRGICEVLATPTEHKPIEGPTLHANAATTLSHHPSPSPAAGQTPSEKLRRIMAEQRGEQKRARLTQ
jgi:hypothetical protein